MMRVLIVEDDRELLSSMSVILQRQDYAVTQATTAHEATQALEDDDFDLILLDMVLPDSDGLQLLMKWQSQPDITANIVAVSGGGAFFDQDFLLRTAGHLGAPAILEKPFSRSALLECVGQFT